jgi:hypothetical protein
VSIGLAFGYAAKVRKEAPVAELKPVKPVGRHAGGYRVPPERILGWKGSPR